MFVHDIYYAVAIRKFRSSRPEMLWKNCRSENFEKFSGKHSRWDPISIKDCNELLQLY